MSDERLAEIDMTARKSRIYPLGTFRLLVHEAVAEIRRLREDVNERDRRIAKLEAGVKRHLLIRSQQYSNIEYVEAENRTLTLKVKRLEAEIERLTNLLRDTYECWFVPTDEQPGGAPP